MGDFYLLLIYFELELMQRFVADTGHLIVRDLAELLLKEFENDSY